MRTLSSLTAAALVVALLTGCTEQRDPAEPTPRPTATPAFASEAEALAAAEELYTEYLAVSDLIASEGGANPERLEPYVTPEWLKHEIDTFTAFQKTGNRQVGSTHFVSGDLQRSSDLLVIIYACTDFSGTHFVNDTDVELPSTGPDRATLQLQFSIADEGLQLDGSDVWSTEAC